MRKRKKSRQKSPGRKFAIITGEILKDIKTAFRAGLSVQETAAVVGISKTTLYDFLTDNPEIREDLMTLRATPESLAKLAIFAAIEKGDIETCKWLLDRDAKRSLEKERIALIRAQKQALQIAGNLDDGGEAIIDIAGHWARVDAYFGGGKSDGEKQEGRADNDTDTVNS